MFGNIIKTALSFFPTLFIAAKEFLSSNQQLPVLEIFTFDEVIAWFKIKVNIKASDSDNIAFTLFSKSDNHNYYEIILGIFNKRTNQIIDSEKVLAKQIDEKLANAHQNNDLVLYE